MLSMENKRKRKKSRDDDGPKKKKPAPEPTDADIEASSRASAAALLSAILNANVHQPHQPFDPNLPYPPFPFPPQPPSVFTATESDAPPPPPFTDLSLASNQDVLRALQDLDMSKIANFLKFINGPPNVPSQIPFLPPHFDLAQQPPPVQDSQPVAGPSTGVVQVSSRSTNSGSQKRTINMNLPGNEQHINPNHAHLLATKWLNANKLADLVKSEGLVYKKGKFSAIEEQQLHAAVERFSEEKGLTKEQLQEIIFAKADKSRDTAFWSELTAAVPLRPIIAVYHHIRRSYHPQSKLGSWKPEEDASLKEAVAELGQQWEKVSLRVGRMSSDCRDRYRNHIVNRDIRVTGQWSKEEEDRLTQIVTDMTIKQGKNQDTDVFWGKVSELMGGQRGRQQCRIKWTDALSKTVKNEGQKPRWSQQDAYILVHKVDSLNVRDDTEIDWKVISDPDWNLWSAHTLQRRWLTLKKSVKGYEDMTHQEIMDILRIKKAHLPSPSSSSPRKRKERKVTSAPDVADFGSRDSNVSTPTVEAGSNTAQSPESTISSN